MSSAMYTGSSGVPGADRVGESVQRQSVFSVYLGGVGCVDGVDGVDGVGGVGNPPGRALVESCGDWVLSAH